MMVVGVVEICTCKQSETSQQEIHYLNIQEQTATGYRPHSCFIYARMYHTAHANPVEKTCKTLEVMSDLTTLARKTYVPKTLKSFP